MLIRIDIKMTLAVFFHAVFADTAKAIETFYKMSSCFAKKSLLMTERTIFNFALLVLIKVLI